MADKAEGSLRRPPVIRKNTRLIVPLIITLALFLLLNPLSKMFRSFNFVNPAAVFSPLTWLWPSKTVALQMPAYTRIRVKTPEDITRLYPLILEYTKHPEKAASVKEFVFRCGIPRPYYLRGAGDLEAWEARETARDISHEKEMHSAIQFLGLDDDKKNEWVKELTWMKPEHVAQRKAEIAKMENPWNVNGFNSQKDAWFAQYAAALLLMLCPNIERLVYEDNNPDNAVLEILQKNNYGLLPQLHLQKLVNVTLLPTARFPIGDTRFYTNTDVLRLFRMFHRLPSIETVSVDAVQNQQGEGIFPPGTANFTKFSATHSLYSSSDMAALIRAPKRLEELTLTQGGRDTVDGSRCLVFPKTIGKALHGHKQSLRKLDLDLDEDLEMIPMHMGDEDSIDDGMEEEDLYYGFWKQDFEEMQAPLDTFNLPSTRKYNETIGSLHDFSALTHLSIGIKLLLGPRPTVNRTPFRLIDALPQSLEHLLIRGYVKGEEELYDDQIREFMASRAERSPNLRVVEGVEECVPSAVHVDDPEETGGLLYEIPEIDDAWLEVE